ncbi:SRPBCC family protein [Gilvimarinus chinensis]|uniref:SRPBCC family protein n=1 Tax=Gilvimarinus chinensis TaxID=396005 RepID=UPI00037E18DA|nr:SRPBCC family protein [Gilvimarinus chinensis]
MKIETLSVAIQAPANQVYQFIRNAHNLPRWVPFFTSVIESDKQGVWLVDTPDGPAEFQFVEDNTLGVLDHTIRFASGASLTNPMRVLKSGNNSALTFTLFQLNAMSELQFKEDVRLVQKDLATISRLIETSTET